MARRVGTIHLQAVKRLSGWLNGNVSIKLRNFLRNVQANMKHSKMDDLAVRKCRRVMQSLLNNAASLAVQNWTLSFKDHRCAHRVFCSLFHVFLACNHADMVLSRVLVVG